MNDGDMKVPHDDREEAEATGNPDLKSLANYLAFRRIALDDAKDTERQEQEAYDNAEAKLFDALENAGIKALRTDRGLFSRNELAWAAVEDEAKAREWAELEMPEAITLNRQRLAVVVRECLKEQRELPPGVTFTTSRKITWRRS